MNFAPIAAQKTRARDESVLNWIILPRFKGSERILANPVGPKGLLFPESYRRAPGVATRRR
jgi:hypothetical protein